MKNYQSIVILTGAGVSAESGLKTFRDINGLWESHRVEDVASPEGFARNPELVHRFYNTRRAQLLSAEVQPNPAHLALARLEKEWHGDFLLVTQNIDDLHERAGSRNLIHMHGEILKARCPQSRKVFEWRSDLNADSACECCAIPARLRPHVVWFGEMPFEMDRIHHALDGCTTFVAIGTSGQVYPAAGFVGKVSADARKVEINAQRSMMSHAFDKQIVGKAGIEVPKYVDALLRRQGG